MSCMPRMVWEHLLQFVAMNQSVKWNPVMIPVKNIATIVKAIYISSIGGDQGW